MTFGRDREFPLYRVDYSEFPPGTGRYLIPDLTGDDVAYCDAGIPVVPYIYKKTGDAVLIFADDHRYAPDSELYGTVMAPTGHRYALWLPGHVQANVDRAEGLGTVRLYTYGKDRQYQYPDRTKYRAPDRDARPELKAMELMAVHENFEGLGIQLPVAYR